jgi:hypothetical protein
MALVTFLDSAPRQYKRARIVFAILLFMGLLSVASVEQMRVECHSEPQYLMLESSGYLLLNSGERIRLEQDQQRCQLALSDFRLSLPKWARVIIQRI